MVQKSAHLGLKGIDNATLQRLCGVLDVNLQAISRALNIEVVRRFDAFELTGEASDIGRAALMILLQVAKLGDISHEDIRLALVEAETSAAAGSVEVVGSVVAYNKSGGATFVQVASHTPTFRTRRGSLSGRTPRQTQYIRALLSYDIVFGLGPAGTGKTYLAVAAAVDAIEQHQVSRIVLVRPAVEAGEKLGFLPGDLAQKVDPYLRPLYDALYDLMGFDRVGRLLEKGLIEIAPLAYMRGRTLNDAYVILDEAQNTTPEQMKMFLTRIGFGAKAVITGDVSQIDLPRHIKSGLKDAREKLVGIEGIHFHTFTSEDIVRHPLVQKIVDAYENAATCTS